MLHLSIHLHTSLRNLLLAGHALGGQSLGGLAIGASFGYICFFLLTIALLMVPIAAATFRVNEGEGYFRWMHARIKEFAESGASMARLWW
jgi:hypothetical protein